ncbi:MAG TPA: GNAT family N-acetyltransferase [Terriglobales bacterium]|nr:GNAT family N-acetyltransferase [Terriglobales bacterium]
MPLNSVVATGPHAFDCARWQEHDLEILDLRHFSSADLRPLLDDEIQVWASLLCWDYSSSAEMILRYMDAKFLPGYAAVSRGKVFGYSFFVYENNKGVIGDLFVSEGANGADRSEVERRLLTHVIETLQQSPGIRRIEAQLLAHEAGAAAKPFVEQGFIRHGRLFMTLGLAVAAGNDSRLSSQFEVRRWTEHDYQPSAAVITAAYRSHVDSEINDQYRTLSGSLRFLNNIVRFPGCGTFDPESSFVAADRDSHSLAGVILCSRVRHDVGHVTQVCVLPEYRAHGLGRLLMAATIRNLKQRKFSALSLTVTEANTRAVELYQDLGFETKRVFDAFVWEG